MKTIKCLYCEKEIEITSNNQRYCSRDHANKYRKKYGKQNKKCIICDTEFTATGARELCDNPECKKTRKRILNTKWARENQKPRRRRKRSKDYFKINSKINPPKPKDELSEKEKQMIEDFLKNKQKKEM